MAQLTVEESNRHLSNVKTLEKFPVGTQVFVDHDDAPRPRYGRVESHRLNVLGEIILRIEIITEKDDGWIELVHPNNKITRVTKIGK